MAKTAAICARCKNDLIDHDQDAKVEADDAEYAAFGERLKPILADITLKSSKVALDCGAANANAALAVHYLNIDADINRIASMWIQSNLPARARSRLYRQMQGMSFVECEGCSAKLFAKVWKDIVERLNNADDLHLYRKRSEAIRWCIFCPKQTLEERHVDSKAHLRFGELLRPIVDNCDRSEAQRKKHRHTCAGELLTLWRRQKLLSQHEELMKLFRFVLLHRGFGFEFKHSEVERVELFKLIKKGIDGEDPSKTPSPGCAHATPTLAEVSTVRCRVLRGVRHVLGPRVVKQGTLVGACHGCGADVHASCADKMVPLDGHYGGGINHAVSLDDTQDSANSDDDFGELTKKGLREAIVKERQEQQRTIDAFQEKIEQASKKSFENGQQNMTAQIKHLKTQLNISKKLLEQKETDVQLEQSEALQNLQNDLVKKDAELAESHHEMCNLRVAIVEETERSQRTLAEMTQRAVDAELLYLESVLGRVTAHLNARLNDTICSAKHAEIVVKRLAEQRGKEDALCRSWGLYLRRWVDIADAIQTALVDARHRVDERAAGIRAHDQRLATMTPVELAMAASIPEDPPSPPAPPRPLLQFDSLPRFRLPTITSAATLGSTRLPPKGAMFFAGLPRLPQMVLQQPTMRPPMVSGVSCSVVAATDHTTLTKSVTARGGATVAEESRLHGEGAQQSSISSVSSLLARSNECTLCLTRLNGDGAPTEVCSECGQVYHAMCVTEWVRNIRSTCPNCRSQLRKDST